MKAEIINENLYQLTLSEDEFRIIVSGMGQIPSSVSEFEFYSLLGCEKEDAEKIAIKLREQFDSVGLDL